MKNSIFMLTMLACFAIFSTGCTGCAVVDPGHAGVRVTFGELNPVPLESGFAFTGFAQVHEMSLQAHTMDDVVEEDSNDAAQVTFGETLQALGYSCNMQWRVASGDAAVALWEEYGDFREGREDIWAANTLHAPLRAGLKEVFNNYTLFELIRNRDEAERSAEQIVQEAINERLNVPPYSIIVDDIVLPNLDYDEQLENAFRATVQARQQQELATQELERERISMEIAVAQAEASRRANVERATGESEAARIAADAERYVREQQAAAEAMFYDSLAEAGVDPNTYVTMQRWNGTVPLVQGDGGSNMPMVMPITMPGR